MLHSPKYVVVRTKKDLKVNRRKWRRHSAAGQRDGRLACPRLLHLHAYAVAPMAHCLKTRAQRLHSTTHSLLRARAPLRRNARMKPGAKLHPPLTKWKARHRNSSGAFPRPNTLSSSASDLTVDPRKF